MGGHKSIATQQIKRKAVIQPCLDISEVMGATQGAGMRLKIQIVDLIVKGLGKIVAKRNFRLCAIQNFILSRKIKNRGVISFARCVVLLGSRDIVRVFPGCIDADLPWIFLGEPLEREARELLLWFDLQLFFLSMAAIKLRAWLAIFDSALVAMALANDCLAC